jgi:NADPH-ferrihemoprotein reductase
MEKGNVGIFCMATHGEGDPTDNAKAFFKYLSDPEEDHSHIQGFKFCVFGLGNTQYEHFNKMGRETNKLLEARGGLRVYKYGEGDDNQSLEEDFNSWKENLWVELKATLADDIAAYQLSGPKTNQQPDRPGPAFTLDLTDQQALDLTSRSFEESK